MILEFGITTTSYVTEVPLTAGTWYSFKVEARNEAGFSDYSSPLSVYAAQVPDTPQQSTTSVVGETVVIDWEAPNDQGAEILGYRILI
jgi:hypothetical protein